MKDEREIIIEKVPTEENSEQNWLLRILDFCCDCYKAMGRGFEADDEMRRRR